MGAKRKAWQIRLESTERESDGTTGQVKQPLSQTVHREDHGRLGVHII